MDLPRRIDELWDAGEVDAAPIEEAMRRLDAGEVRVAEKLDGAWVVNEWAKKAILLYFKLRKVEPMDSGAIHYLDKSQRTTRLGHCLRHGRRADRFDCVVAKF